VPGFSGTVDIPYTICDSGIIPQACAEATLHVVVTPPVILPEPDVNAGETNKTIPGNVSTNDKVPAGTTYGNPPANPTNPSNAMPVINPDGTYTFSTSTPGVYTFNVPVCIPGGALPCPTEPLVITITDPTSTKNVPIANVDLATTPFNTPVTVTILRNDGPGNAGGTLGTPTIIGGGMPGSTATIDPSGKLIYTPPTGFIGNDTIRYKVCESPVGKCDSTMAIITVLPPNAVNTTTATDDYAKTTASTPVSGNVKTNDMDAEGNVQKVTPQNLAPGAGTAATNPVFGKGTLSMDATGHYTFTPVGGFAGTVDIPYTICNSGVVPQACAEATLHIVVTTPVIVPEPDINAGEVNKTIPGNVSTNDNVPPGTTYGTPAPYPSNPSTSLPVINPDGSYTFNTPVPGIYNFNVPVCVPGGAIPCPTEPLVITITDPTKSNNLPVANTDITTTPLNTPVTVPILANDGPGNVGGTLGTPVVYKNGMIGSTATITPGGQLIYTPATGFVGTDSVKYRVCESPGNKCDTAIVYITVLPADVVNTTTASDDYAKTPASVPVSGNVKTNDSDPQGNKQKVTPQSLTATSGTAATNPVFGKGTLSLDSTGNYTFTPATGFTGTVDIPYTVCDSGATPMACAEATLHVVVTAPPFKPQPDVNAGEVNVVIPGNVSTNDVVVPGTTYSNPAPNPSNPSSSLPVINPDGTYTFTSPTPGVYTFNVPVCVPNGSVPCPTEPLVITITDPTRNSNPPVLNTDLATTKLNTPVTLPILSNDGPGNVGGTLALPTIVGGGKPGSTATIDPTGKLVYTPAPGFTGNDTITYQACETPGGQCKTSIAIITVLPANSLNTTAAADDYYKTAANTPVSGSVKTNDKDPEGNVTKVTAQNLTPTSGTAATNPAFGKGTLSLSAAGTFTFTPVSGFVGTVDIPYTICDSGIIPQACAEATLHIVVSAPVITPEPDVNAGLVNTPIPGNVTTNDKVPAGTTYSNPAANPSNPSSSLPVINPDGTYTFNTPTPGVYTFNVPVCTPGGAIPCPTEPLVITITDPTKNDNVPLANVDLSSTKINTPVTVPILTNDGPGNTGGTLGTPTIIGGGKPGSTSTIDPTGKLVYTPPPGFTGIDTIKYKVCETPSGKCDSTIAIITVLPADALNSTTATDDYATTPFNTPVSGNVKSNDVDPEGNVTKVTVQNLTPTSGTAATNPVFGKGTLTLDAAGGYSFTPVPGFSGTVDIPYTICDSGVIPQACAEATLHGVVTPPVILPEPDVNAGLVNTTIPGNVATNDKVPAGSTYSNPAPNPSNPSSSLPVINSDGTYTFSTPTPGVYTFSVPVCTPGGAIPCPTEPLVITITDPTKIDNVPLANVDLSSTKINTPVTVPILSNDGPGNTGGTLGTPTIIGGGKPGSTSTIDPTGKLVYTPAPGFTGIDTIKYKVCETPSGKCDSTMAIITVLPVDALNSTTASDDYATTPYNTPVSGNVKTNDKDPEGNVTKVTAQNLTPSSGTAATNPVFGKGTLTLDVAGVYSFTPAPGFSGTVDIPYTICDSGVIPQACAEATLHIVVVGTATIPEPDVNAGNVNTTIPGNVATNDKVPAGTTYSNPAPNPANPSSSMPVINPDGTYTFNTPTPGVYTFNVPYCVPAGPVPCPTEPLVITIMDQTRNDNPPVANVDLSSTKINTPVTVPILANDGPGNTIGTLGMPTIVTGGKPGSTVSIDPTGKLVYTPPLNFTGNDTILYKVCETPSGKCDSALAIITVLPQAATNSTTASDDYLKTPFNSQVSGNVKTNDKDPEGNVTKVQPQNLTPTSGTATTNPVFGKGTLVMNSAGDVSFTPVPGFYGTLDVPYTICDSGVTPQACAEATLHIVVNPPVIVPEPDINAGEVNKPIPGNVATNDNVPTGTTYGNPSANPSNPGNALPVVNPDGTYSFTTPIPGIYTFNVHMCIPGAIPPCPTVPLVITVIDPTLTNNPPVANTDLSVTPFNTPVTVPILANDGPGNTGGTLGTPVLIGSGKPGATVSIDPTGNLVYSPPSGYVGKDTIKYQVCETPSGKCDTTLAIITVQPPNAVNTTLAADDYNKTNNKTPVSGNVKTNDTDPEGNPQKVTPQTLNSGTGTAATNPVFGKGSLTLDSMGNYTFIPDTGFTGTVAIPYFVCDSGARPQVCAQATLYIVVTPYSQLCLNVRAYLEGALMNNANAVATDGRPLMRDNLRNNAFTQVLNANFIPVKDPYEFASTHVNIVNKFSKLPPQSTHPEFQQVTDSGLVFGVSGQNAIVDWAFVELRSKSNNALVQATRSGLIQRDGDIVDVDGTSCLAFPGIPVDSYYVAVRHRSHLGIMTQYAQSAANLQGIVDLTLQSTPLFDFGTTLNSFNYTGLAANNNVKTGYHAMWQGDFNADKKIKFDNPAGDDNVLLFDVLNDVGNVNHYTNYNFSFGYWQGDFNMDGKDKYDNPSGDDNLLLFQVLNYGQNSNHFTNFNFFLQQLP